VSFVRFDQADWKRQRPNQRLAHGLNRDSRSGGDGGSSSDLIRGGRGGWSPSQEVAKRRSTVATHPVTSSNDLENDVMMSDPEWVFTSRNATTVRAHIGSMATLPCFVKKGSQFGMITWARIQDSYRPYSVLTIGDQNYVEDKRYVVSKPRVVNTDQLSWSLRIRGVSPADAGRYECQATTHPPQSIVVRLKVVEAVAEIVGPRAKIIKSGSNLKLQCVLKRTTEEPLYIFWYHNSRMINYDTHRQVRVSKDRGGSILTLVKATDDDSGNYTCSPYNVRPDSVSVHVLKETGPAEASVDDNASGTSGGKGNSALPVQSSAMPILEGSVQITLINAALVALFCSSTYNHC